MRSKEFLMQILQQGQVGHQEKAFKTQEKKIA